MTVEEFARLLGIHPETVRVAYRNGLFDGHTVRQGRGRGGRIYISTAFLRENVVILPTAPQTESTLAP
ncbi:helix-turn-helix domain-containing protein [Azospirillum baldaniorum]|uniref:helix-turn-helix domain-containing protein n=1 Tax=Azospirillum baldaniorum TaxID=1064539 RepID=UPI0011AB2B00